MTLFYTWLGCVGKGRVWGRRVGELMVEVVKEVWGRGWGRTWRGWGITGKEEGWVEGLKKGSVGW
jgi:hypothetical protein